MKIPRTVSFWFEAIMVTLAAAPLLFLTVSMALSADAGVTLPVLWYVVCASVLSLGAYYPLKKRIQEERRSRLRREILDILAELDENEGARPKAKVINLAGRAKR